MVFGLLPGPDDEWWGCLSFLFAMVGLIVVVPGLTVLIFRLFGVPVGTAKLTGTQGTAFLVVWWAGNLLWWVPSILVRRWDYRRQRRAPRPWAVTGRRLVEGLIVLVLATGAAAMLALGAVILYEVLGLAGAAIIIAVMPFLVVVALRRAKRVALEQAKRTMLGRAKTRAGSAQKPAARPTRPSATDMPPPPPPPGTAADTKPGPPPGWLPDPYARYELRYWNGEVWTEHVADGGRQAADPM